MAFQIIFQFIFFLVISLPSYGATSLPQSQKASSHISKAHWLAPKERKKITPFRWQMPSGEWVTQDNFKGKVLFLNFWSNECAPCKADLPQIKELASFFNHPSFQILLVNMDAKKSLKKAKKYWKEKMSFLPTVFTAEFPFKNEFSVTQIPTYIAIDKSGLIVSKFYGTLSKQKHIKKINRQIFKLLQAR